MLRWVLVLSAMSLALYTGCGFDSGGTPPGTCIPACDGLTCGDDGCGASCGTCSEGLFCNDGVCGDTCASDSQCTAAGQTLCNDDGTGVRTCEAVAAGCFQLGTTALCGANQVCDDGSCQLAVISDCVVITPLATRLAQPTVGSVAVAFSVSSCAGEPQVGLGPSAFSIYEDGDPISATEAGADILRRQAVTYVTLVLDNSPSVKAAGGLQDAVAAAKDFASSLMVDDPLSVRVAVAVFSLAFELRQAHTSDLAEVHAAIDGLLTDDSGVNTTNLYGALIDAIAHNSAVQNQLFTEMRGGVLTQGQVIMFTDGSDQAAAKSFAEALEAVQGTHDQVRMLAFGTEVDSEVLESLASGGAYVGSSSAELGALFSTVAEQVQAQRESLYVLGYCSPKVAGTHQLTLEIPGKGASLPVSFSADGWLEAMQAGEPSCKAEQFAQACTDLECGGLWCGGCVEQCTIDLLCGCLDETFTGAYCDQCADPKLAPPGCTTCVDATFTGDGCDQCANPLFIGEDCDQCADPAFTGPACNMPSPCPTAPDGSVCNDGDACTLSDVCLGDLCVGAPLGLNCDDGNPCTADACDPVTGTCASVPQAGPCDDENSCTIGDYCVAGDCLSGVNQCACEIDADCAWKDDGDLCNGALVCGMSGGAPACVVAPTTVVVCPETTDPCTVSLCDPTTGQCGSSPVADGVSCADSALCDGVETCQAGVCAEGVAMDCDDGSTATLDECVEGVGCVYTILEGEPCDDADACTSGDIVVDGLCTGAPVVCDDENPCTMDTCSPDTGCEFVALGGDCDDGDPCTTGDQCSEGQCIPGSAYTCEVESANDACFTYACQTGVGCVAVEFVEGVSCDDNNPCTFSDTCTTTALDQQLCLGTQIPVDDGNPCTDDACVDGTVTHTPIDGLPCGDGNPCTTVGMCSSGQCIVGQPLDCGDGNPCTEDTCQQENGVSVCSYEYIAGCEGCSCDPEGIAGTVTVEYDDPTWFGADWTATAAYCQSSACADADDCTIPVCVYGELEVQAGLFAVPLIEAQIALANADGTPATSVCGSDAHISFEEELIPAHPSDEALQVTCND